MQGQQYGGVSQARLSKRTESPWRKFWGKKWNGRLADNFVHLKNNIDRLLLDLMEHVEKSKIDT